MSENIATGIPTTTGQPLPLSKNVVASGSNDGQETQVSESVSRRELLERWRAKNGRALKSQQTPLRVPQTDRQPNRSMTVFRGCAQRASAHQRPGVSIYCTPAGRRPVKRTEPPASVLTPAGRVLRTPGRSVLTPAMRAPAPAPVCEEKPLAMKLSFTTAPPQQQQQQGDSSESQARIREKLAGWRRQKDEAKQQRDAARRAKQFVPHRRRVPSSGAQTPALHQASGSLALRLTSALSAAHRATLAGQEHRARRIYQQIPRDATRFQGVRMEASYWTSYALFEEYHGHYVASLRLYEQGLEAGAQPAGELEQNLVCFMLRTEQKADEALDDDADSQVVHWELQELLDFMSYVDARQEDQQQEEGACVPETPALPPRHMMAQGVLSLMETREGDRPDGDALVVQLEYEESGDKDEEEDEEEEEEDQPRRSQRLAEVARQRELERQRRAANRRAGYVPWWLRDALEEEHLDLASFTPSKFTKPRVETFQPDQRVSVRVSRRAQEFLGGWIDATVLKQTRSGVRVLVRGQQLMLRSDEVQLARGNDERDCEWVEGTQVHMNNAAVDALVTDIWWEATIERTTEEGATQATIRLTHPGIDESPTKLVDTRHLRLAK